MLDEKEAIKEKVRRVEQAAQRAAERARIARWDMDIVVFMFAVLILVMILLFQGVGTGIVAPVGFLGLALCWLVGWRRGKQLYARFYNEELSKPEPEQE